MQVTIKYLDNSSFTKEEAVRRAVHNYGKFASVEVYPDSTNAHDFLYFAVQQMITHEQLSLLFDKNSDYNSGIDRLRKETLYKIAEIVDTVLIDNESKATG